MKDLSYKARQLAGKNKRLSMVAQELQKIISSLLLNGKIKHPLLVDNSISITGVDVAPNLSTATVSIRLNFSNDTEEIKAVIEAFNQEAYSIKKLLRNHLTMKVIPNLVFTYDALVDKVAHINALLDKIKPQNSFSSQNNSEQ